MCGQRLGTGSLDHFKLGDKRSGILRRGPVAHPTWQMESYWSASNPLQIHGYLLCCQPDCSTSQGGKGASKCRGGKRLDLSTQPVDTVEATCGHGLIAPTAKNGSPTTTLGFHPPTEARLSRLCMPTQPALVRASLTKQRSTQGLMWRPDARQIGRTNARSKRKPASNSYRPRIFRQNALPVCPRQSI
ncbi:hypothetical protein MGG_16358 [Pyricularia oryzae 70-15]|uniref:Uncharacterized protein n=3 Tax=Pyricularia oryzae TaxID=318829 RepID=G4MLE0_PYRO7|nr:uncharacterized protein MGG_16358 [Pyricularia oryzae 70-15]EHA57670.1 hypothetical protein MGG_16358 [Pyricularia oryzae 70-15]ELQ41605.1 hypothetical protein OOU_Y34scaffold00266g3 [Pyricularia oryzae Y34]